MVAPCHPERSEGSLARWLQRFFAALGNDPLQTAEVLRCLTNDLDRCTLPEFPRLSPCPRLRTFARLTPETWIAGCGGTCPATSQPQTRPSANPVLSLQPNGDFVEGEQHAVVAVVPSSATIERGLPGGECGLPHLAEVLPCAKLWHTRDSATDVFSGPSEGVPARRRRGRGPRPADRNRRDAARRPPRLNTRASRRDCRESASRGRRRVRGSPE